MSTPIQQAISIAFQFDVTATPQFSKGDYQVYPAGMYLMQVVDMSVVENKEKNGVKTGHHLRVQRQILEPAEFRGGKVSELLNLWHTGSDKAREIAMEQLSALGHSVGVTQGGDLGVLAYRPHVVHLGLNPAEPDTVDGNGTAKKGRPASNEILRQEKAEKYNPAMAAHSQPAAAPAPAGAPIPAPPGIGPNGAGIHTQPQGTAPAAVAPSAPPPFPPAAAAPAPIQAQAPAPAAPGAAPAPTAAPAAAPAPAPVAGGAVPPWLAGGAPAAA